MLAHNTILCRRYKDMPYGALNYAIWQMSAERL
jgi:hypothetical protein